MNEGRGQARCLNKIKTCVPINFNPKIEEKKAAWNDMFQYELLIEYPCVGKYLDIYR